MGRADSVVALPKQNRRFPALTCFLVWELYFSLCNANVAGGGKMAAFMQLRRDGHTAIPSLFFDGACGQDSRFSAQAGAMAVAAPSPSGL